MRQDDDTAFADLIRDVSCGSQEAARELVEKYYPLVLKVVRRRLPRELRPVFDSIDFAQVAWNSVFRHRSQIGRLETKEAFARFLAAVASNKVTTEVRRRLKQEKHSFRRERALGTEPIDCEDSSPTPSQHAIAHEALSRILAKESERDQFIVHLRRLGYSTKEIGQRLGLNDGSVRRILGRIYRETSK